MAADSAERRIEVAHARLVGGEVVGEPRAARVVEMRDRNQVFALQSFEHFLHGGRRGHARGITQRHVSYAQIEESLDVGGYNAWVDRALERAAERDRYGSHQAKTASRRGGHVGDV